MDSICRLVANVPAGQPGERSFEDDAAEQLSPAAAGLLLNPAWTSAAIGEHNGSANIQIHILAVKLPTDDIHILDFYHKQHPASRSGEHSFEDDAAEQPSPASANLLLNPAWTSAAIGEHELILDLARFKSGRVLAHVRCQLAGWGL